MEYHRWYDARVGRWISEDPIGFRGKDGNLARYVRNACVLFSDTKGLIAGEIIAGAALGFTIVTTVGGSGGVTWSFDTLKGTLFVDDNVQTGLQGWSDRTNRVVDDWTWYNIFGATLLKIKWQIDWYFHPDGHISQVIPSIVDASHTLCVWGSVTVVLSEAPGNFTRPNEPDKKFRVVDVTATYTFWSPVKSIISTKKYKITGDGGFGLAS